MPTQTIKAIQTRYKGYRFRSRLEARWAVVLDNLEIKWQYEAEGYNLGEIGCYLPDFWLPDLNTFLEIKPNLPPSPEEMAKLQVLLNHKQAFGAWGFDLNSYENIMWHWRPERLYDPDGTFFRNDNLYPWPDTFKRSNEKHTFHRVYQDSDEYMVCPICGSDYVHVSDPVTLNEDYPHDVIGLRGPIHVFQAISENCSHRWELAFAFHKGNTAVVTAVKADGQVTPLESIVSHFYPGTPTLLFIRAVEAGKSARFEHGESP
jgi:hypothetical protein